MSNIIAVIWDFDKTLVDGYMQDPLFKAYGVDSDAFWDEVNGLPAEYERQGVRVNRDTIYLNHMLAYVRDGRFAGLNNAKLRELGKQIRYYPGIPEFFSRTKEKVQSESSYQESKISVEHYIVSTGIAQMIRGSDVAALVEDIWGCEFIESQGEHPVISEVVYTIDNTTKTRALFEINKGVGRRDGIEVNSTLPEDMRRVPFRNMIYIADGPSDVPAFSLVTRMGGATFAVYPRGNRKAFRQVERLRQDGRVQMYAEADYTENSPTFMWITNKIDEIATRIVKGEKERLYQSVGEAPRHLS